MVVLYRKHRPQKLSDLVGQEHVKNLLLNTFVRGKISHAYLFIGPKGTGKTTTARIVAKMLNCEKNKGSKELSNQGFEEPCNKCDACEAIINGSYLDVLEIDAASNRGIDDIRDLREKIKLAPVSGRYKVYIVDEVHMLTGEAFNALLKTLEEPPGHTVFILCTTEGKKVPETIVSRCQKLEFKRAKIEDVVSYLKKIAGEEKIAIGDEALTLIAQRSEGAFRNGISLLDQLQGAGEKITVEDVKKNLSLTDEMVLEKYFDYLHKKDVRGGLLLIKEYGESGKDINALVRDLLLTVEKYLLITMGVVAETMAVNFSLPDLKKLAKMLSLAEAEMKFSFLPELPLELLTIEWCGLDDESSGGNSSAEVQKKTGDNDEEKVEDGRRKTDKKAEKKEKIDIAEKWPDVLRLLKPFNNSLELLLKKCQVESFDGETLTIVVYYKLHKDLLMHPKNHKVIIDCLQQTLGDGITLEVKMGQRQEAEVVSADDDELIKRAEEIFK